MGAPGVSIGEAGGRAGAGRGGAGDAKIGPAAPGAVTPAGGACRVAGKTIAIGGAGALAPGAGACGMGIVEAATFAVSGRGIGCRGPVAVNPGVKPGATPGLACGVGRAGIESGRFTTPLADGAAELASGGCKAPPPPNGGRNG